MAVISCFVTNRADTLLLLHSTINQHRSISHQSASSIMVTCYILNTGVQNVKEQLLITKGASSHHEDHSAINRGVPILSSPFQRVPDRASKKSRH